MAKKKKSSKAKKKLPEIPVEKIEEHQSLASALKAAHAPADSPAGPGGSQSPITEGVSDQEQGPAVDMSETQPTITGGSSGRESFLEGAGEDDYAGEIGEGKDGEQKMFDSPGSL